MFSNLPLFQNSHAMAQHAGLRQALVAENMANSDTPGYLARDLQPFRDIMAFAARNESGLTATRAGHFGGMLNQSSIGPRIVSDERDPNGNGVSLEQELLRSVDAKRQHDRALSLYRAGLDIMRASLGRN